MDENSQTCLKMNVIVNNRRKHKNAIIDDSDLFLTDWPEKAKYKDNFKGTRKPFPTVAKYRPTF